MLISSYVFLILRKLYDLLVMTMPRRYKETAFGICLYIRDNKIVCLENKRTKKSHISGDIKGVRKSCIYLWFT